MEHDRAREILCSLADGWNPVTGEQFPPGSPYQHADIVRALYVALAALEKGSKASPPRVPRAVDPTKPKAGMPRRSDAAKAGGPWSPEEEQQLHDAFVAGTPVTEIAAGHGRTTGAITARLVRLGLLADTAGTRTGRGHAPEVVPTQPNPSQPEAASPVSCPPPSPQPTPRPSLLPPELTQAEKDTLPF